MYDPAKTVKTRHQRGSVTCVCRVQMENIAAFERHTFSNPWYRLPVGIGEIQNELTPQ